MAESLDSYSDIEDGDEDCLTEIFNKATERVKSLASALEPPKLLELYSHYKQATEGSCNIPRPRWYEMQAKTKWDAWNNLGNMSVSEAKQIYIKLVSELDPDFEKTVDNKSGSWITVSCLARTEDTLQESDKTIFDYVKESDLNKLSFHLKNNSTVLTETDDDGLGLIHWAADRGNVDILKHLLQLKVNVNMTDKEGQTALHYAVSCDHIDCVRLLLDKGADVNVKDEDGTIAKDLATDSKLLELLNNKT